ncbi:amidohydrolase, partial [Klebsiella pneumoniae]|nr:amidohydrolase [Klebsiella pneumoniae]
MDGAANLRHFDGVLKGITGRDIILLPEMFTTGFAMEAAESSLPQDDVVAWLHAHAQTSNALVGGSAAIQTEKGAVNRFLLVEPNGT